MSRFKVVDRAGRFILAQRGEAFYIRWYNAATRQTDGFSLGAIPLRAAQVALSEHHIKHSRPVNEPDLPLHEVLELYWLDRRQKQASAGVFKDAARDAMDVWGERASVASLTAGKQREFIQTLRARGLSDHTIDRRLRDVWAALNYVHELGSITSVPAKIGNAQWDPDLAGRDRVLTRAELAKLLNASAAHEHWRRYMIAALGTAGRPTALLKLARPQVNFEKGVLDLQPKGAKRTKKRNPIIPMADTLRAWLADWGTGLFITYNDRPMTSDTFFDRLTEAAGMPDVMRYHLRHTVRTWLAEQGVSEWEADQFMGHRSGGAHMGAKYAHYRPEYMRAAAEAIQGLYEHVAPLVEWDLLKQSIDSQPAPGDHGSVATAWQFLKRAGVQVIENAGAGNEARTRDLNLGKE